MDLIKSLLNGNISLKDFLERLYNNQELQDILDNETNIKPYTNDGSLLLFFLNNTLNTPGFEIDSRDALKQFLSKNGVEYEFNTLVLDFNNLVYSAVPKWLYPDINYFQDIYQNFNGHNKKEIKELIKAKVTSDFKYIKSPPRWLQDVFWPIRSGKPLIFIGELGMDEILHDTSKVFVFYDRESDSFENIVQSY